MHTTVRIAACNRGTELHFVVNATLAGRRFAFQKQIFILLDDAVREKSCSEEKVHVPLRCAAVSGHQVSPELDYV